MSSWWDSRAFYHSERVAEEKMSAIEKCYNLNHIDKDIEDTIEFLQHLEKAQKACQKLLSAAYYHRGHVEETKFRYQVYYERSAPWRGKVNYYTGVYIIPCFQNGEKYKYTIENKRWSGKERHLAKLKAFELAKIYKCGIIYI